MERPCRACTLACRTSSGWWAWRRARWACRWARRWRSACGRACPTPTRSCAGSLCSSPRRSSTAPWWPSNAPHRSPTCSCSSACSPSTSRGRSSPTSYWWAASRQSPRPRAETFRWDARPYSCLAATRSVLIPIAIHISRAWPSIATHYEPSLELA